MTQKIRRCVECGGEVECAEGKQPSTEVEGFMVPISYC